MQTVSKQGIEKTSSFFIKGIEEKSIANIIFIIIFNIEYISPKVSY